MNYDEETLVYLISQNDENEDFYREKLRELRAEDAMPTNKEVLKFNTSDDISSDTNYSTCYVNFNRRQMWTGFDFLEFDTQRQLEQEVGWMLKFALLPTLQWSSEKDSDYDWNDE